MSAPEPMSQRRETCGNDGGGVAVATTERDMRAEPLSLSPGSRRASAAAASTLAGLTLLACVRPAAAQQDLGSVVCVASELESLAGSDPVRRVIRRDTELVHRVGVDPSVRAEAEQALRAELGASGETSCAWSLRENDLTDIEKKLDQLHKNIVEDAWTDHSRIPLLRCQLQWYLTQLRGDLP